MTCYSPYVWRSNNVPLCHSQMPSSYFFYIDRTFLSVSPHFAIYAIMRHFSLFLNGIFMPTIALPNPLVLVDGSSNLYRAFHAFPPTHQFSGWRTNPVPCTGVKYAQSLISQVHHRAILRWSLCEGKTFRRWNVLNNLSSKSHVHRCQMICANKFSRCTILSVPLAFSFSYWRCRSRWCASGP